MACCAFAMLLFGSARSDDKPRQQLFNWDTPKFKQLDYHHTIRTAQELDAQDHKAFIAVVAGQIRKSAFPDAKPSESRARELALRARIQSVDLNGDGVPEFLVQPIGDEAGCGATGNCPFWVFAKTGAEYKLILQWNAELYRIEGGSSSGYRDIALAAHNSASNKTIYVFGYEGSSYRQKECYSAEWSDYSHEEWRSRKSPLIQTCQR